MSNRWLKLAIKLVLVYLGFLFNSESCSFSWVISSTGFKDGITDTDDVELGIKKMVVNDDDTSSCDSDGTEVSNGEFKFSEDDILDKDWINFV